MGKAKELTYGATVRLSELLKQERDEILRRFVAEVRGSDLAGATETRPRLLDDLPRFLDRVTAEMSVAPPSVAPPSLMAEAPGASPASTAQAHGSQRWELGYDVRELVREYGILRDVIIGLLAEAYEPLDLAEYRVLTRHLSLALAEAVGQFSDDRDATLAREAAEHFAFLSHELRSPLTVAFLEIETWTDAAPCAESVAEVRDSLQRMARLIDGTLVSERLRSGRTAVTAVLTTIDLGRLTDDVVRELLPIARRRHVEVHADVVPASLAMDGDPRLLASALSNLVGNAVKFTHEHSTVKVRVRVADDLVRIDVEDECGGLPVDAVARAFEPFVQLGTDRTGFGLGLAIARQAAEAHGGHLVAVDRPGCGCRFTLTLPCHTR